MAKLHMNLAPKQMLELCDWVDATDPSLMVEGLTEVMRDQARDAIDLLPHLASGPSPSTSGAQESVLMSTTIEGSDEHIMYAMMRWKQHPAAKLIAQVTGE